MRINECLKIWFLCVNFEKLTSINGDRDQRQPSKTLHYMFLVAVLVYFGEFLDIDAQNQIFWNGFDCIHYHLCKNLN